MLSHHFNGTCYAAHKHFLKIKELVFQVCLQSRFMKNFSESEAQFLAQTKHAKVESNAEILSAHISTANLLMPKGALSAAILNLSVLPSPDHHSSTSISKTRMAAICMASFFQQLVKKGLRERQYTHFFHIHLLFSTKDQIKSTLPTCRAALGKKVVASGYIIPVLSHVSSPICHLAMNTPNRTTGSGLEMDHF